MWADWLRKHAHNPGWMQHVIRIPETDHQMRWDRWSSWAAGDPRWHVHTIDTTTTSRETAAKTLADWIEAERTLLHRGLHPLALGDWAST